jgi:enediyne biosynthesis protein E4
LFTQIPVEHSSIYFSNDIIENEKYNVYDYHNLYNGGGIAAFDANNDGLIDLYFTGNQVSDKLYINKGNFEFEDITDNAGIIQKGWSTGVTIVDINSDGFMDIYVCKAGNENAESLRNLLFINQGGLTFKEEAEQYGLADTSLSTQAAFFDYDKDGDLDCYILTTSNLFRNPNQLREKNQNGNYATDKLYRNNGQGHFDEVGLKSGITENTHGLGLAVADINGDGWEDILASSDFLPNDALYINNRNGTFTNKAKEFMPYQSRFSMGNDIADLNNDGLPDIITVDMLPPDNEQQKKMLMTSYHVFETEHNLGYQEEFTRNMLFQNAGNDINGKTYFNEIGQFSGIHATDWSWAPLIMDLDNDGQKDVFISNGYMRDVTNSDIISYNMSFTEKTQSEADLKEFMNSNTLNAPRLKSKNQFFKNNGSFKFSNESDSWITQKEGFSNGAIFADLDNDGDLDYVVNNINEKASLFRNESTNNYLVIKPKVNLKNASQVSKIISYHNGICQTINNQVSRGYLSSMATPIIIGLGKLIQIDSLNIIWSNNTYQKLEQLKSNQTIEISPENATYYFNFETRTSEGLFSQIPFDYQHIESRYIDFYRENLLLKKYSQPGPVIATSDIDGNGFSDVFIGGNSAQNAIIYFQFENNQFKEKPFNKNQNWEDSDALFIDINNDNFDDLYTLSGSNEFELNSPLYKDHVYLNDGLGNLIESKTKDIIPFQPGRVICEIDIDRDGNDEIFRAGAVLPGLFPEVSESFIINPKRQEVVVKLGSLGIVTDAKTIDYNKDGWDDLLIVGEYMSPTLYINKNGKLEKHEDFGNKKGLWNCIEIADLNQDGFSDIILGNVGENYRYTFNKKEPLEFHQLDITKKGQLEKITTYYQNETRHIIAARDELIRQYPYLRTLFPNYESYAIVKTNSLIIDTPKLSADYMKSVVIWNINGESYELMDLPNDAQRSSVKSILAKDFNNDGKLDILLAGNDHDSEPINAGYSDGSKGSMFINKGNKRFDFIPNSKTGIWLEGSIKQLINIENKKSSPLILAAPNTDKAKLYKINK